MNPQELFASSEQSAAIAKEALKEGGTVYDLVLENGVLTKDQLDDDYRNGT